MILNFLGTGAGFSDTHTGAYFISNKSIIFIDCSMLNLSEMINLSNNFDNVYVYLTHMHLDHCSGLGLFAQFLFYTQKKKLKIRVPEKLLKDLKTFLKITGVTKKICDIKNICIEDKNYSFIPIQTFHAPELKNKCFGYLIEINNKKIIYTGDTNTLQPFMKYINNCKELYVDVSALYGTVHLKYDDIKEELYNISLNCDVYIMHIDNEKIMKELTKSTNLKLVQTKKDL